MRTTRRIAPLLVLTWCAMPLFALADAGGAGAGNASDSASDSASDFASDSLRAILSEPLPDDAYAGRRSCIGHRQLRDTEVLDQERILFYGPNGRIWLNQLKQTCFGLDDDGVLAFDIKGAQICRLDRFRAHERMSPPVMGFTSDCYLGDFELVTEAQAELLREALGRAKRSVVLAPVAGAQP